MRGHRLHPPAFYYADSVPAALVFRSHPDVLGVVVMFRWQCLAAFNGGFCLQFFQPGVPGVFPCPRGGTDHALLG